MARRPKATPTDDEPDPKDNDLIKLEAIFASVPSQPIDEAETPDDIRLKKIIKLIGDKYIEVLGTSKDYAIDWLVEPIDGEMNIEQAYVTRVSNNDSEVGVTDLIDRAFYRVLNEFDLGFDEALTVINGIIERIEDDCALRYRCVNDRVERIEDGEDLRPVSENDVVSDVKIAFPSDIEIFVIPMLKHFRAETINNWWRQKTDALDLPDKVIAIKRRLNAGWLKPYYRDILEKFLSDLNREVEFEKERKTIRESIYRNDPKVQKAEMDKVDKKEFPDKFTRMEVAALLTSLMHEFKDATNQARAEFIGKLTPHKGGRNLVNELSYLPMDKYENLIEEWKVKFMPSRRGARKGGNSNWDKDAS